MLQVLEICVTYMYMTCSTDMYTSIALDVYFPFVTVLSQIIASGRLPLCGRLMSEALPHQIRPPMNWRPGLMQAPTTTKSVICSSSHSDLTRAITWLRTRLDLVQHGYL